MSDEETPEWLKPGDDSSPSQNQKSSNNDAENFEMEGATAADGGSGANVSSSPSSPSSSKRKLCKTIYICTTSSILLALFLYAAIVQNNDPDKLVWSSYYGLLAVISAVFIVRYLFSTNITHLDKLVFFLCAVMNVWSIVFIIFISLELGKVEEEGRDKREELIFELSGACLGLVSVIYHAILTFRCVG
mmetsp:Transcript_5462/g.11969  ORF Transcript_5462/g.11969 Transcript_5462/m.11969 type:complete len:189 (-) Transcript_5462:91-657(-)